MQYTVKEKTASGDAYVIIEADGQTYGQVISMEGINTPADLDARVAEVHAANQARVHTSSPAVLDDLLQQPARPGVPRISSAAGLLARQRDRLLEALDDAIKALPPLFQKPLQLIQQLLR